MNIMTKFFVLLLFLVITSCGLLMTGSIVTYELVNETPYQLHIQGFSHRVKIVQSDTIIMEPNSSLLFDRESGEGSDDRTFFSVASVDSVRIVFDSEKLLVLTCDDLTDYYCHEIIKGNFYVTITEDDYNQAVPIE